MLQATKGGHFSLILAMPDVRSTQPSFAMRSNILMLGKGASAWWQCLWLPKGSGRHASMTTLSDFSALFSCCMYDLQNSQYGFVESFLSSNASKFVPKPGKMGLLPTSAVSGGASNAILSGLVTVVL
jgi:hypothetical protein